MRIFIISILFALISGGCTTNKKYSTDADIQNILSVIDCKLKKSTEVYNNSSLNPRSINTEGSTHFVASRDWTSGFYPGCLWYMYELTGNENYKNSAVHYTTNLRQESINGTTHDMGFKMYCSYGNGYRLTGKSEYREILLESAKTLIKRYNPSVGCIRSWDHHADVWQYPVIIDNMMNLELLLWAFSETGDSVFYNISVNHADKTIENHFREDFSSYHVIDYDTISGEVLVKNTHQGFSDESAWARGQAWGLYGYTMMYRETGLQRYLMQAEKIAEYILSHKNLPNDKVPYWDFDAPAIPNEPRDVSAAAIMASALFELSTLRTNNQETYAHAAEGILKKLSSNSYLADKNAVHYFVLEHSTGNKPDNSEIDVPIIYADYYFLEALKWKMMFSGWDFL